MGYSGKTRRFIEACEGKARCGEAEAAYELGIAYSVGDHGVVSDLIEAHKWFNLAAMSGVERAKDDRAEIAADLSRFEIAEAQRRARAWINAGRMAIAA